MTPPRQRSRGRSLDGGAAGHGADGVRGRIWEDGHRRWLLSLLTPSFGEVVQVRAQVRRVLELWRVNRWDDEPVLLMSELATNAVQHARTLFSVGLTWDGRSLRGAVTDANPLVPVQQTPGLEDEGGRGLWLVERLSSFHGVDPGPYGKTVWFEMSDPGRGTPRWAGASRWSGWIAPDSRLPG